MQAQEQTIEREVPLKGRPRGKPRHVQDDVFTDEAIKILIAYLNYTTDAGQLKWGFYTSDNPTHIVNEVVELPSFIDERHRKRMGNLIMRMRYAMDARAADQFESIFQHAYYYIAQGMPFAETVQALVLQITNNQTRYKFLTLTEPELPHLRISGDILIPMVSLLKDIIMSIRVYICGLSK